MATLCISAVNAVGEQVHYKFTTPALDRIAVDDDHRDEICILLGMGLLYNSSRIPGSLRNPVISVDGVEINLYGQEEI